MIELALSTRSRCRSSMMSRSWLTSAPIRTVKIWSIGTSVSGATHSGRPSGWTLTSPPPKCVSPGRQSCSRAAQRSQDLPSGPRHRRLKSGASTASTAPSMRSRRAASSVGRGIDAPRVARSSLTASPMGRCWPASRPMFRVPTLRPSTTVAGMICHTASTTRHHPTCQPRDRSRSGSRRDLGVLRSRTSCMSFGRVRTPSPSVRPHSCSRHRCARPVDSSISRRWRW